MHQRHNSQKKLYSYYACTSRNHRGTQACETKPVPAEPLEQVIAERLIQLSKQDRTVERIVREAMAGADELLGNLQRRRVELVSQSRTVAEQIEALVDSIASRRVIKSVGKRITALEERQEQLEAEILDVDLEIQTTKAKAVSAQSLTDSLTTFGDLFREAIPQERRELIRLRVNQLVWTPDEIRVALIDPPEQPCQMFDESQQLVARTLDSTNLGIIWDKFHIFQGHRRNTPYIQIGRKGRKSGKLKQKKHANALKQALHYRDLLESGQADSQTELARLIGTPRSTVSAYLRLLNLDQEVQDFALNLDDSDERLRMLTESQLRSLVGKDKRTQKRGFGRLIEEAS